MINANKHNCLSCGADLANKRSDAKYCSARCRMRYRRERQKIELIQKLAGIFGSLLNHAAQCTDHGYFLTCRDATSGNIEEWTTSDLKNMSIGELKRLIKQKNWLLVGNGLRQLFSNRG
jgi:predicted nucleic acid-binding Zn ribbon protein